MSAFTIYKTYIVFLRHTQTDTQTQTNKPIYILPSPEGREVKKEIHHKTLPQYHYSNHVIERLDAKRFRHAKHILDDLKV